MMLVLANLALGFSMRWNELSLRQPLLRSAQQVEASQLKLLHSILQKNKDTTFGLEHNFASISTWADYRSQVPVRNYDQLKPYIDQQLLGVKALTAKTPIFYARTSGTTGCHKDIPMTDDGLLQVKHAQKQLALSLWKDTRFMHGAVLGFASPAEEGKLANGCPFGSVSGSTYKSLPALLERKFVVPSSAFSVAEMETKYQIYAMAALACGNLTGMVAANPSSILKLMTLIQQQGQQMLMALDGQSSQCLTPEAQTFVPDIIRQSGTTRVQSLLKELQDKKTLTPDRLWPQLSAIATWTGGSCGIALQQLKPYLPKGTHIIEYGYAASEFMGSVNIDAINNYCIPSLTEHVFEFVERATWESEKPRFLGAHELTAGNEYYVFVTTQSGLYRYNINDIIRAGDKQQGCHTIEFLQKGKGVTNITGEKLSEHQLITAVSSALVENEIVAGAFMAVADPAQFHYTLYIEIEASSNPTQSDLLEIASQIDKALSVLNIEYRDKRASQRLKQLQIKTLQGGAANTIKSWSLDDGVRETQYKPTILGYANVWTKRLEPLLIHYT